MRWYTPILLSALAAIALVFAFAAGPQAKVVRMTEGKTFDPKMITVEPGGTVVWKNASDMTHSVTDDPSLAASAQDAALPPGAEKFNSGFIAPGKDFSHTFKVPGTYRYFCIPHEEAGMVGTVVVSK
jgi:plastocyanin